MRAPLFWLARVRPSRSRDAARRARRRGCRSPGSEIESDRVPSGSRPTRSTTACSSSAASSRWRPSPQRRPAAARPGSRSARPSPALDRLRRVQLRRRRDGGGRAPARCCPRHQLEQGQAARRESDGMILAEDELGLGADHSGIMLLLPAAPSRARRSGTASRSRRRPRPRVTGNRPDLQSVMYGIAREVAASLRLAACRRFRGATRRHPPARSRSDIDVDRPRAPATSAASSTGSTSPPPAVAADPSAGDRRPPDLQRRRRHELRHARCSGSPLHAFDFDRAQGGSSSAAPSRRAARRRSTASRGRSARATSS